MRQLPLLILTIMAICSCSNRFRNNSQYTTYIVTDSAQRHYEQQLKEAVMTFLGRMDFEDFRDNKFIADSFAFHLIAPISGKRTSVLSIQNFNGGWLMGIIYFHKNTAKRIVKSISNPDFRDILKDTTDNWFMEVPVIEDSLIKSIADTLKRFEIANIPMQHQIPELNSTIMKGYRYILIYSTQGAYRTIEYIGPNLYSDKEGYNQKVIEILKFLKRRTSVNIIL